ncbi:MAG: 50S ribosomal protein L24 [Holosporales bacterium]
MAAHFHVRRGDKVVVTTGKDKGATGEILSVLRAENKVVVKGVNIKKRHTKPSMASAGGIVEKEGAIHISNVLHADPKDGKPTRVGVKVLEDGRKVRYAKRSGEMLD